MTAPKPPARVAAVLRCCGHKASSPARRVYGREGRHYTEGFTLLARSCPGAAEYGHGLSLTTVHGRGCCERWDKLVDAAVAAAPGPAGATRAPATQPETT